jgi:hypothetical protein
MLVNKKTDAPLSGFTCAVFYLKNGSTLAVPAQDLRAGDTCSKGVPVKFSKIRPTAFETDTETALIKSVEIQFHSRNSSRPEKNTFRIGN